MASLVGDKGSGMYMAGFASYDASHAVFSCLSAGLTEGCFLD